MFRRRAISSLCSSFRCARSSPVTIREPRDKRADSKEEDLYEFTNVSNRASFDSIPIGPHETMASGRKSLAMNPLMILKKVDNDRGSKIVKAIEKIQGKPDSMRLTESQQQDLVNAFAETKWYGVFWKPFRNVNYSKAKRYRFFANVGITTCVVGAFTVMFNVYVYEMATFSELDEADQLDYQHIIMNVPIGKVKAAAEEVLQIDDPKEALTQLERAKIALAAMRRKGWHTTDWAVEGPRTFKPWYETGDVWHPFFWCSMWIGSMCSGGGPYFAVKFGNMAKKAKERRADREFKATFDESSSDERVIATPKDTSGWWRTG